MSKTKPPQPRPTSADADLPEGWIAAHMGDVASVVGGGTPRSTDADNFADDGHPWITPADLSDFDGVWIRRGRRGLSDQGLANCSARLVPRGTVLLSSRAPIGYVAVAANELCTNQGFKSFILAEGLAPEFVFYWLCFTRDEIERMGSGSTFMEVSGAKCREIPIAFAPLPEQKRIVAKVEALLERVNAARARLARLPAILKRFRQSVLAAACSGQLTAEWREGTASPATGAELLRQMAQERQAAQLDSRRSRQRDGDEEDSSGAAPVTWEVPDTWEWAAISDLLHYERSAAYGVLQPGADLPKGVPFVRVCDLANGTVDTSQIKRIAPEIDRQYPRTRLQGDEVLVSLVGTIGRIAVAPKAVAGANVARAIGMLPLCPHVLPQYLRFALENPAKNTELVDLAREVARKTLNLGLLKAVTVPLPPRAEQREIVRRVEALFALADGIEAHVRAATVRAERMPQAILGRAFRGELVPTEADLAAQEGRDYEPASVLLARIRAEAAQRTPQRRTRSRTAGKKAPMRKLDKTSVLRAIEGMATGSFAFEELRAKVPGDYDELKDILFALLDDPQSGIIQVFDKQAKAMRIRRRGKA